MSGITLGEVMADITVDIGNGQTLAAARFLAFLGGPLGQSLLTRSGFLARSHATRALA